MGGRRFKPSLFKLPSPPSSACRKRSYSHVDGPGFQPPFKHRHIGLKAVPVNRPKSARRRLSMEATPDEEEDYVMVDADLWLEKDTDIPMSDVSSDSEDDSSDPLAQATSFWETFYVPPPFAKRSETESDTRKAAPAGTEHPLLSGQAAWDYLRPKEGVERVMEWYLRIRDKPLDEILGLN